uniref:Uncharacterized protein n=1 Tax=Hyaloperonospora arabidopsidis (strain Emoy2) TaxID=559515 RepID=M4BXG3_HYAAE
MTSERIHDIQCSAIHGERRRSQFGITCNSRSTFVLTSVKVRRPPHQELGTRDANHQWVPHECRERRSRSLRQERDTCFLVRSNHFRKLKATCHEGESGVPLRVVIPESLPTVLRMGFVVEVFTRCCHCSELRMSTFASSPTDRVPAVLPTRFFNKNSFALT